MKRPATEAIAEPAVPRHHHAGGFYGHPFTEHPLTIDIRA